MFPLGPREGIGSTIESYVTGLTQALNADQPVFPLLQLNDIEWDRKIEDHSIHVPRCTQTPDPTDECEFHNTHDVDKQ